MAAEMIRTVIFAIFVIALGSIAFSQEIHKDAKSKLAEENKKLVLEFYQKFFGDHDIESADKYIHATEYLQHNPTIPDGLQPLKDAAKEWFVGLAPEKVNVRNAAAEGDFVYVHVKTFNGETHKDQSSMDLFKVVNGLIVEHWDVNQDVPDVSLNTNTMF